MRAKHLYNLDFLNYKRRNTDSLVWKNILKSRELLKEGLIWKVGKGDQISFWFNNWIENRSLMHIIGIDESNITHPDAKVSDFITQESKWDSSLLISVLNDHPIVKNFLGIPIPIYEREDSFC